MQDFKYLIFPPEDRTGKAISLGRLRHLNRHTCLIPTRRFSFHPTRRYTGLAGARARESQGIMVKIGQSIGESVTTLYARPNQGTLAPTVAPHSVASSNNEAAVRVSISADAMAALAQDTAPEPSTSGEIIATVVPDHDIDAVFESWRAKLARGKDLSNITDSLAQSMQEVMEQRPDLSQAQFDFVLEDGRIRIVDDQLSARDRSWLEGKLNANTELRTAVRQFHDNTVDAYALAHKAYGMPLSEAEYAQANAAVDRQFKYMSLLRDVAGRIQHEYRAQSEFSFRDQRGTPFKFEPDPSSAQGVVDFMSRIRSLQSGPLTVVLTSGRSSYTRFNDPFSAAGLVIGDLRLPTRSS